MKVHVAGIAEKITLRQVMDLVKVRRLTLKYPLFLRLYLFYSLQLAYTFLQLSRQVQYFQQIIDRYYKNLKKNYFLHLV